MSTSTWTELDTTHVQTVQGRAQGVYHATLVYNANMEAWEAHIFQYRTMELSGNQTRFYSAPITKIPGFTFWGAQAWAEDEILRLSSIPTPELPAGNLTQVSENDYRLSQEPDCDYACIWAGGFLVMISTSGDGIMLEVAREGAPSNESIMAETLIPYSALTPSPKPGECYRKYAPDCTNYVPDGRVVPACDNCLRFIAEHEKARQGGNNGK